MITTLSFYDFDSTLFSTPMPDSGKEIWKEKTGNDYPHVGWWGRPESLDSNIFNIKPFSSILDKLGTDNSMSNTYTVMLTSRIERLKPEIEILLNLNNIKFDSLSLKRGGDGEKDDRIKEYLQKFPNVKMINIYDDRDKEINIFNKMKNDIGDQYEINIYRVTDGTINLVESISKIDKLIFEEINSLNKSSVKGLN